MMVKRFISSVFTFFVFLFSGIASAQTADSLEQNAPVEEIQVENIKPTTQLPKNEIQLNVGALATGFHSTGKYEYALLFYQKADVSYMRNLTNRFGVGGQFSIGHGSTNLDKLCSFKEGGRHYMNNKTFLVNFRLYYVRKPHFGFYGKLGLGSESYKEGTEQNVDGKDTKTVLDDGCRVAYDFIPIGLDFGDKHLHGVFETDFGTRRFTLNLGLKYSF